MFFEMTNKNNEEKDKHHDWKGGCNYTYKEFFKCKRLYNARYYLLASFLYPRDIEEKLWDLEPKKT